MTSEAQDIAVIGMAVRMPQAADTEAFLDNLRDGRDSVRELSARRRELTCLDPAAPYRVSGWVEDVDHFDHAFFGVSKGEADSMAPEQRLLLEVAYQAVENAGLDPRSLHGSRTAVYVGDTRFDYPALARRMEPTLVIGTHHAASAGRLARYLGLRGPAAMVDSSCSSALLAVHHAVGALLLGDAELALVGGVNLNLSGDPVTDDPLDLGIRSADGRTRAFSAGADGTGSGEAVAVVLLKPLAAARRDGDVVHAVIKGIAANNVAGRSSTLTAPDSASQAEVIGAAWERAGVDPLTVTYVEAHGTATRLGDPIEIEALDRAFGRHTDRPGVCAISTAKSNLGHTWSASGLVGLVKAVLALRSGTLFPSLHTEELSPLIDFARSAVTVTRRAAAWEPACGVRRAGVSSFGVMGTNVHAVLEEAPARPAAPDGPRPAAYWFPVSGRSATALEANAAALAARLEERPELDPADVQFTLVAGRAHHPYRRCVTAGGVAGARAALAKPADTAEPVPQARTVLLVSGLADVCPRAAAAFRRDHPVFAERWLACEEAAGALRPEPGFARFAFGYALHGLLGAMGLELPAVVAEGAGKHVVDACAGRTALAEAIGAACREPAAVPADLDARVDRLLARFAAGEPVRFVEAGGSGTISGALLEREAAGCAVVVAGAGEDAPARWLADLYLSGAQWDLAVTAGGGRRVELPSYRFDPVSCWLPAGNLRAPDGGGTAQEAVAPAPAADVPVLEAVTAVWQEVLGGEPAGPDVSFFDLGGDSISSIQVLNRLQSRYGTELDEFALFDHDTPRTLAAYVELAAGGPPSAVADEDDGAGRAGEPFPASAAQLQVWLASQFEGGSVAFNLTRSLRLTGEPDVAALEGALAGLARRHEGLRAVFSFSGERLWQTVTPAQGAGVPLECAGGGADPLAVAGEFAARPFDLTAGPLLRAQLVRCGARSYLLTVCTHHIVADGWSLGVLMRDLGELYGLVRAGAAVPAGTAGDYRGHHLREADRARQRREADAAYWRETFATVPEPLALPYRAGAEGPGFRGAYRSYELPGAVWQRVLGHVRARGGTAFTGVLGLFGALLSRYSDHGDLVLGTSAAGRGDEALEGLVGMLVRTVPVRLSVDPERGFGELSARVRQAVTEALRHPDHPYEELTGQLRRSGALGGPHLFDVLVEFEQFGGAGDAAAVLPGLVAEPVEVTLATSVFPLNVMLAEEEGTLRAWVRFDTARFAGRDVDGLWEAFTALAAAVADRPDEPLRALPLLSDAEAARVRAWGHRELEFDPGLRVHRAFEEHARRRPESVCLSAGAVRRTFAQTNARANRLARHFTALGVRPGDVVALLMDRSLLTVESVLALWKCGAAYLPVDPGYPPAFVAMMLESARVRLAALDPSRVTPQLRAQVPADCAVTELTATTGDGLDDADLDLPADPADGLAYVIYTSGSTGVPKGVMVEHLGMLNHLHAKIADLALDAGSVVVQNASNSFDISLWQMFAAPFAGGRTVVVEEALQLDPPAFAERIAGEGVTVLEVVPSYLETMLDAWKAAGTPVDLSALRYLMVTGEACLPRQVNRWLAAYPHVPVVNAYGPTEASDDVTHHVMREPVTADTVPLGRPVPNTYLYVLDEHLRVLPRGAHGGIFVSGVCVGRGYLNAPEQTAKAFLDDPFVPGRRMYRTGDVGWWNARGELEYLGRDDSQVKVRGFRVDLGEIERRLDGCPGVRSAAVVVKEAGGDKQVHGYVVLEPGAAVADCREQMRRELPAHMVPSEFVVLDRLPLTSNGKVDRPALRRRRDAVAAPGGSVPPRTAAERTLAGIWRDVLGVPDIGVTDRFFDIGGNSLRAIQVLTRVRTELGAAPGLEALFAAPTIEGLAAALPDSAVAAEEAVPLLGGPGDYDVAPAQRLLLEVERGWPHRAAFNRNDLFDLPGHVRPQLLERALELLAERHESLRTTYELIAGEAVQRVHAPGALRPRLRAHDLRDQGPGALAEFVASRTREPFDAACESLVRADLLRTGEDGWALLVAMHQLVSDGVSAGVLAREWQAVYAALAAGAEPALPGLPFQYKDVAAVRAAALTPQRAAECRRFWTGALAGVEPRLPLPADFPRPGVSALAGERLYLEVPDGLSEGFAALARREGVTEFTVARCAVGLLLAAETGRRDLVLGTYTLGRSRAGLEDQIGFHVNTVPLRFRLEPGDDVPALLRRGRDDLLAALRHEEYPYGRIMRDLGWRRGPEGSPVFDVMVALDQLEEEPAPGDVLFIPRDLPRRSKEADLQFVFLRHPGRLELALTYNTEVFSGLRARGFLERLRTILGAMTGDRPVAEVLEHEEHPQ